jgi:hypothetical protein
VRRAIFAALLTLAVAAAGCSGGDDDDSGASTRNDGAGSDDTGDGEGTDTTEAVDGSPFCVAIRSLEALGAEPASGTGTSEEVLAENAQVTTLVEEATANAPEDAPADVQALFDDYLLLSAAIEAAGGDTEAAFTALSTQQPALMERLSQPDAHREAFTFFAGRCGIAAP